MNFVYLTSLMFISVFLQFNSLFANSAPRIFDVKIFKDSTNSLDAEKVEHISVSTDNFFPSDEFETKPFDRNATYWLFLKAADSISVERSVLTFHKWISLVEVYPFPYDTISAYGGRMVPGRLKTLSGCNVLLEPGINNYLVKVQNRIHSIASSKNFEVVPFYLFYEREKKIDFFHGLLLGAFILMLIYNLVFFFFAKSKLHLYYVIYILLNTLFLSFTYNYSEVYLFPDNYKLNHILLSGQIIGAFFYTMFLRTALLKHCTKYPGFVDKKIILPFAFIILGLNLLIGATSYFRMDIYMAGQAATNLICSLVAYGLFIYCFKTSDKFMRIIMLGSMMVFLFGYIDIVKIFYYIGSFNMNYEFGLLLELLLFTYALNRLYFEEKYQTEMEKHQLENELQDKNRELVYTAIQLSAKEEAISSIKLKIKDLKTSGKPVAQILVEPELNYSLNKNLWNEFEKHFNETHPGFYRTLMDKYPDLSQSEIRLCAFLKLNLNTKEIAMITQKSAHSIEAMRSRIRQKMELQRDANFTYILSRL